MKDPQPNPIPIRIISHNIRYATSEPFEGELPWENRRRGLISQLRYHTRNSGSSPFICLQEVLDGQLKDIRAGLNVPPPSAKAAALGVFRAMMDDGQWEYIGVGRDDGKKAGEYEAIFYNTKDWTLLESSTVWLSETPSKPSLGWDAGNIRTVTIGIFKHNISRKIILALNTHFDLTPTSRKESAKIVLKVLRDLVVKSRRYDINAAFLAGDLNSEENEKAYEILNDDKSGLRDCLALLPAEDNNNEATLPEFRPRTVKDKDPPPPPPQSTSSYNYYGNTSTYTGFGEPDTKPTRIDFIHLETGDLVKEKESFWNIKVDEPGQSPWLVEGYSILENKMDDGVWISDHRPVVCDALLVK